MKTIDQFKFPALPVTGGEMPAQAGDPDKTRPPAVHLGDRAIPPEILAAVPPSFVRQHRVVPFAREAGRLLVACADPLALEVMDTIAHLTGEVVQPALAGVEDLDHAIRRHYEAGGSAPAGVAAPDSGERVGPEPGREGFAGDPAGVTAQEAPLIARVESIIAEAVRRRASDIHLEPLAQRFRVRYRVDGVLLEAEEPPRRWQAAIISRLKIMAGLSIAERRLPQDGRLQVAVDGRRLDLRVSSLPTVHGESIVMRILDPAGIKPGLPELGFLPDDQAAFEQLTGASDGMVLVTGPTGSGKTTTLYAGLHQLNSPGRKIITVEDPVEYQLAGINQVPVTGETGMTFPSALRAMLRQAPNVVMVGEIRDRETAEIAIHAALTGHLVFSTLHTNDAPSAVTRLIDLGAKPFLVASALRAVVAQRLVRRICPACKVAHAPADREWRWLGLDPRHRAGLALCRGAGCPDCQGTGFQGRIGIFEFFLVHDGIRSMIYDNVTAVRLREQARRDGMRTMREDGFRKVLAGLTTIEEVVAATAGHPLEATPLTQSPHEL